MQQILHIFKKDVRRHWLEILISIALLGMYARVMTHRPADESAFSSFPWYEISAGTLRFLMIVFWIFLPIRLVQGENLVGDRQWWVTKPYEWWKLLAAKEIFLLVFIAAPLFLVQLFLLHQAGFPILSNLVGVFTMQFALAAVLFLPAAALGALTKSLGQAFIALLVLFFLVITAAPQLGKVPNIGMFSAVDGLGEITAFLILGPVVGAMGWQYARRKAWSSRGLVAAGVAFATVILVVTPYERFVNRKYPLMEPKDAPVQISAGTLPKSTEKLPDQGDHLKVIPLRIPLIFSGVGPGRVVFIEGVKLTMQTGNASPWESDWERQSITVWPEGTQTQISIGIDRKKLDQLKAQKGTLQIEFALSEYQEEDARDIVLQEGEFSDPTLGLCSLPLRNPTQVNCRRPFREPGLMATFDPARASCEAREDDATISEDKISHLWFPPSDDSTSEPGIDPVSTYELSFRSGEVAFTPVKGLKRKTVYLCPGAHVKLAKPHAVRVSRLKVEVNNIALQDLIYFEALGGGSQYDLRVAR